MATSTTYLERTFAAGNRKKWTWSAWVKRANLGSNNWLFHTYVTGTNECSIFFTPDDQFAFSIYTGNNNNGRLTTNRKFRDTNAWYHLQCVWDTANSTASNRMRIYVNGVEETSFATDTNPPLNYESIFNSGINHTIGQYGSNDAGMRFSGCISHMHFSDGYALAPTVFGSTDSTTGEWEINASPSFTPGTNGFTILKDGNTITDQSANSNNWSLGAGTLTKTEDCPSSVFATANPLVTYGTNRNALTEGNNTTTGIAYHRPSPPTIAVNKGKWYFEAKALSGTATKWWIGLCDTEYDTLNQGAISSSANYIWGYDNTTNAVNQRSQCIYSNNLRDGGSNIAISNIFSAGAIAVNDIYAMAVDLDNQKVWYSKNGVWNNGSGTESTTWNSSYPDSTNIDADRFYSIGVGGENSKWSINYGNGFFGTTAVSSAGTNASNNGIFEYDVPTGYTALSTKGLNL